MAQCNWDPAKHNGKSCPVHGASGTENNTGHKLRINGGKYQVKYSDSSDYEDTDKETYEHLRETASQDFDENIEDDFGFDEDGDYKIYEDKIREELEKVKTKEDAEYVSDLIDNNMEAGYISEEMADELYNELDKKIDESSPMNEFSGPDREGPSYAQLDANKQDQYRAADSEWLVDENGKEYKVDKTGKRTYKPDTTKYNGAEVIGGDDDNEGMLKNKTPLSEEESNNLNPNNPKYKDFSRSHITNAKLVDEGYEFTNADGEKVKESIIEYIPYGALQDGDNRKLYGVVRNYDGSDAPNIGAIVSPNLERAKEDLEHQVKLGIQGSQRYMKLGQFDEDFFNILRDYYDENDPEDAKTRQNYSKNYGWDYNKPFAEHDFMKNDPYEKWKAEKYSKGPVFDKARTSEKTDYNFTVAPTKFYKKLESLDVNNPKQVAQIKRLAENYADDAEADIEYDYDSKTAERLKNVYAELASEISRLAEKTSDRNFADIASKIVKASKQIKGK